MKYLLLLLLLTGFTANAIIIRHDTPPENYHVKSAQYPSVINLTYLTGTLIDEQWILTAAHGTPYMPANQKVIIEDNEYFVEHIVVHPDYDKNNLSHDIALLKLNRKVTGVKSTGIYRESDEKNQHVWFVGKGDTGNGLVGVTGRSDAINHAENIIDEVEPLWITFDFDHPTKNALTLEGISGPGDSGGPAFIRTDSGLKVAGVSSHQRNNDDGEGLYEVEEFYTRTSTHQAWIGEIQSLSHNDLKKKALPRTPFKDVKASPNDITKLLGSYFLPNNEEFILEVCPKGICYRWDGQQQSTELLKAEGNYWFSPMINRSFQTMTDETGQVYQLKMNDFHGQRILTKKSVHKESDQVSQLKAKIKTHQRELIQHVEPIWPEDALLAKTQGSVTMSFSIDIEGKVSEIVVIEAIPKGVFEQAAMTALSQWRYAPLSKPLSNILTRFDFTP